MCMFYNKPKQPRIKERTAFKVMNVGGTTYPNGKYLQRDVWVRATHPSGTKLSDYGFHVLLSARSAHNYMGPQEGWVSKIVVKVRVRGRVFGVGQERSNGKACRGMRVEWIKLPAVLKPIPSPKN